MQQVIALYTKDVSARVRLLGYHHEEFTTGKSFRTVTLFLCYTSPRKNKVQRSPQAQVLNTIYWCVSGKNEKLEDFEIENNIVSATLPGYGRVSVQLTSQVENVRTERGSRVSPLPVGFHCSIECEQELPLLGVGYSRRFGSGRLKLQ